MAVYLSGRKITPTNVAAKKELELTITPNVEERFYIPPEDSVYRKVTAKEVTAEIDDNIKSENIKTGINILGVDGSLETLDVLDDEIAEQETLISALQAQVDEIPSIDVESADATESDVLAGKTFYGGDTKLKTGTLTLKTLTVNENGIYNASDKGFAGWSSITVDVGGVHSVEVRLPDIFNNETAFYYAFVDDDKILISTVVSGCGLWLYTISSESMVQIYSTGQRWQYFQQISATKWLISSYNSNGILLYNAEDNSCEKVYSDRTGWSYLKQLNDTKWLITNNSNNFGILLYNLEDDSCKSIYSTGLKVNFVQQVTNDKWLLSMENFSNSGILLYTSENDTITKIYDKADNWRYYQQISETKWLISSSSYSVYGILLYDSEDDSITHVYDNGYNYMYFQQVTETKWLISSESSVGMLLYNSEDGSFISIYTQYPRWNTFKQITNAKWLITGIATQSNNTGILMYNSEDDSVTQIYDKGKGYDIFKQDVDNNYYISGSDKVFTPRIVYYTESTNTISMVSYCFVEG